MIRQPSAICSVFSERHSIDMKTAIITSRIMSVWEKRLIARVCLCVAAVLLEHRCLDIQVSHKLEV